ncbi:MAG TPA: hypothetical protein VEY69_07325 [Lautropia sp.]|jgi:hypothetical protein|nr:hypothetical protein [Lautropia sp.]
MLRLLITILVVLNLALFGRLMGWLPGLPANLPDRGQAREVNPERLKILPEQPGAQNPARP